MATTWDSSVTWDSGVVTWDGSGETGEPGTGGTITLDSVRHTLDSMEWTWDGYDPPPPVREVIRRRMQFVRTIHRTMRF